MGEISVFDERFVEFDFLIGIGIPVDKFFGEFAQRNTEGIVQRAAFFEEVNPENGIFRARKPVSRPSSEMT